MIATTTLPRLSWSQVSTYTQCPAKWWFSRHFPMERTPSALKFGSAIHKAVEVFYAGLQEGYHAGMDEMLASFLTTWELPSDAPISFSKNETPDTLKSMAERMLTAFLESVKPGKIISIEEPFAVEIADGLLVSGVVDLLERKNGKLWIVDNKTARNSPSDAFDKEQVSLYRLGLQELGVIPFGAEVGLRYDVLRKLKTKGEFVSVEVEVGDIELAHLRQKLVQVAKAMEQGIIYRIHSWACEGCPWSKSCEQADLGAL